VCLCEHCNEGMGNLTVRDTLTTADVKSSSKSTCYLLYVFIWLCFIMICKNFSLYMYSSSFLRSYNLSMAVRVVICGVDIRNVTVGIVSGFASELTVSKFNFNYINLLPHRG
jgi:hypothetical protein